MKLSASSIRLLISLLKGECVADSKLKGYLFTHLKEEGYLLAITHGSRKSWRTANCDTLRFHLADSYGLNDLEQTLQVAESENVSRAELVSITGDSKSRPVRTFKGFMVNSFLPVDAELDGDSFSIFPLEGTFTFIYDCEHFKIAPEVVVVGIENPENFRYIARQRKLFADNVSDNSPLLFVCRYPQQQHADLIKWLKTISNRYVHFGDLDLAGIKIFLSEYLPYLGSRASFLVPKDFDERIASGSPDRYNDQLHYMEYIMGCSLDPLLRRLVESIQRQRRGYDQEGFILLQ